MREIEKWVYIKGRRVPIFKKEENSWSGLDKALKGFTKTARKTSEVNKWYNSRSPNENKYKEEYKKLTEKKFNAKTQAERNKIIDQMNKLYAKADKEGPKTARALEYVYKKYWKELKKK